MKTVWTLNILNEEANHFDYEIFTTREKAVEAMNKRKEAVIENYCFDVYYQTDRLITLVPEDYDGRFVNYRYMMWINERVIY